MVWCVTTRRQSVGAHTVWKRGAGSKGSVNRIVMDLEERGYAGNWDQEQGIVGAQRGKAHRREGQAGGANDHVGDSRSHGAAESAIQQFRGICHKYKAAGEEKPGRKVNHNEGMGNRLIEDEDEVMRRFTNSEYEDGFMEWNQGRRSLPYKAQCGEQALCVTDRTRQSLSTYEAQFNQATVMGLNRKTDEDTTGSSR